MKRRAMKFLRSALSMLLACSMIAGMGITTFAAETEEDVVHYVSIGDSTTNGYGLEDYAEATLGYGYAPEGSYPALVAEQYGWELTQLAITGMRAEELHCLLDSKHVADDYTAKLFNGKGGAFDQAAGKTNGTGAATLRLAYKEAITNADVISINIGSENLGGYVIERVMWAINEYYGIDLNGTYYAGDADSIATTTDGQALLVALSTQLTAALGSSDSPLVDEIVDAMLYGALGLLQNYAASLEIIRQWNPDAEIIVVGLSNPVEGLTISLEETGEDLDLTDVFAILVDMVNAYLLAMEENGEPTYYAEPTEAAMVIEDIAALKTDAEFDCSDDLERHLISEVANCLVSAMLGDGGSSSGTVTALATELLGSMKDEEAIAEGVGYYFDYCDGDHKIYGCGCSDTISVSNFKLCRKVLVGAAYLGLRDALIASAGESVVDGAAVEAMLAGDQSPVELILQSISEQLPSLSLSTIMSGLPQAFREAFAKGFTENEGIYNLLIVFTHLAMADSIGTHANVEGHAALADALVKAYDGQINPATAPGGYYACQDNYYVSLGGGTAYGNGLEYKDKDYADLLIEELAPAGHKELSVKGLRIEDVRAIVDSTYTADAYGKALLTSVNTSSYVSEIKKATIITLCLDSSDFFSFAISQMNNGYKLDWDRYLGADAQTSILGDIERKAADISASTGVEKSTVKGLLESYAYAAIGFACNYAETLDAIRALNPNATLVIVGMYNPMDGLVLGSGDNAMDLGELMQSLVDLTDLCYGMYATLHADTVFVSVPDTASGTINTEGSAAQIMLRLMNKTTCEEVLYATADGHAYIAAQVIASIEVAEHNFSAVVTEPTCTAKGYTTYTCKCCGHTEKSDYTDSTGHQYDSVVTEPTCTEKGYTAFTCTECGHSYKGDYTDAYCPSSIFPDVEANGWYHSAVDFVVSKGLMNGTGNGLFSPALNIDRASFIVILYRMAGSPKVSGSHPFTDTTASWYADAVLWAYQTKVSTGTSATTFSPTKEISRQELVTLLYRFCQYMGYEVEADQSVDLTAYPDSGEIASWAMEGVQWACDLGIITGRGTNGVSYLAPAGNAGRHEIATIIMRFYPMIEG